MCLVGLEDSAHPTTEPCAWWASKTRPTGGNPTMLNWNLSRREMLKLGAAGVLTASFSGWLNRLAAHAAQTGQTPHKRCILPWMDGGPSHKDTFDLPPSTDQGGPF